MATNDPPGFGLDVKIRIMELIGFLVLLTALATVAFGLLTICFVEGPWRYTGIPLSAGSYGAFRLGWRMFMRPDAPFGGGT